MIGPPTTFWAKLERSEGRPVEWHPLLAHSADVAAVMEALLARTILGRRLARLVGWKELTAPHVARLSVLAALHDAGKVNNGFQARKDPKPSRFAGHVAPMIAAMGSERSDDLLRALGLEAVVSWFESEYRSEAAIDVLCATWGHHGRPVPPRTTSFDDRLWNDTEENRPVEGLRILSRAARRWFPSAFDRGPDPIPDAPGFRHAYNGVLNLADWLASNRAFFEFAEGDEERIDFARDRAAGLLASMHLDPGLSRHHLGADPVAFEGVAGFEPYEIQRECIELSTDSSGSVTILESDTGSGKTEAAVARFIRLFQAGEVDGMYFAVPTRSAATQLYDRVVEAVRRTFLEREARPPVVLAVPGYVRVDQLDGDPNALPGWDVQWPDDEPDAAERGWAAESSRRYLAGAIAVGTVDQVLLSSLQVRHAHLRAASLLRHFLVVDEVHSSDPYMRRVLEKVLDHHRDAGGHALLMSATLGTADRAVYTGGRSAQPPPLEEAVAEPYPLLSHRAASKDAPMSISARSSGHEKTVEVGTWPIAAEHESVADKALQFARKGARVLVIRNLVADCVATQRALEVQAGGAAPELFGPPGHVAPHHSRYAPSDRRTLDAAVEHAFGKETTGGSVVAVTTQTVEQSLDIDTDVLVTDLCPADVLLQRIGRLHRHPDRRRPDGFETPWAHVLVPETRDLAKAIVEAGPRAGSGLAGDHGLGTVYRDLRVLEATWRLLVNDDRWSIPSDNRRLVEQTTHPARLEALTAELGGSWLDHEMHVLGERLGEEGHSELVTIDRAKPFKDNGFLSDVEAIKTRLGNDDWMVEFEPAVRGPFGTDVGALSVPTYWLDGHMNPEDDTLTPESPAHRDGCLTFELTGQRFVYDRLGLRPQEKR